MKKVAIQEGLGEFSDLFQQRGYAVVTPEQAGNAAALVISGATDNFAGIENMEVDVPVINAEGKTPQEVYEEVERAQKQKLK
ncbi:MAG: YkuS family protein [Peptococcaceae bacterium]|nr:YkuS family protein [Peptococcaceae bacterium]